MHENGFSLCHHGLQTTYKTCVMKNSVDASVLKTMWALATVFKRKARKHPVEASVGSAPDKYNTLSFDENYSYCKALETNNVEKVALLLSQAKGERKNALMNGEIHYGDESSFPQTHLSRLSRPLFVAIMMGATEVVELLIKQGAEVHQRNIHGENIMHTLVVACALEFLCGEQCVAVYERLRATIEKKDLHNLLMQENNDELRPLEMAANLGCVLLYEAMHLTPDVYVTRTVEKGPFVEKWIDVTEYESYDAGNRRNNSPMVILAFLDQNIALEKAHGDIVKCDLITTWLDKKLKCSKLFSTIWVLDTLLFTCLYMLFTGDDITLSGLLQDVESSTNTSNTCPHSNFYFKPNYAFTIVVVTLMLIYCFVGVMYAVCGFSKQEFDRQKLYSMNLTGSKNKLVSFNFLKIFIFNTTFASGVGIILCILDIPELRGLVNLLITTTCMSTVWALLFHLQVSSLLGHYTMVIQKMVMVLYQFMVLYFLMFLPYVHAFLRLLKDSNDCLHPVFSPDIFEHFYHTFLVAFNMYDMTQFKSDIGTTNYFVLIFVHQMCVFTLVIMMINFFIALLSTSVAEVMQHKETIMLLQKMNFSLITENYMLKLGCFRGVWKHFQRKHFHVEGGKYYLKIVTFHKPVLS